MRNADDEECDHRVPFARDVSAWAAESAADADSATAVREAFETAAASKRSSATARGEYNPTWIAYLDQLISHLIQLAQIESNHAGVMFLPKITPPANASNDDVMELYRIAIARALDVPIKLKGSNSFRLPHKFSE